jgi:hypothetical protein
LHTATQLMSQLMYGTQNWGSFLDLSGVVRCQHTHTWHSHKDGGAFRLGRSVKGEIIVKGPPVKNKYKTTTNTWQIIMVNQIVQKK